MDNKPASAIAAPGQALGSWLGQMLRVLSASLNGWLDQRAASKGAALAFYTLFSMVPILLLAIVLAGYLFGADSAQAKVLAVTQDLVGPNGAVALQALLVSSHGETTSLWASVVAGGLLLLGSTSVFVELKDSLDELWGAEKSQRSGWVTLLRTRLLSFIMVLLLGFLLLLSLFTGAALSLLGQYVGGVWRSSAVVFETLAAAASYSVVVCLFAVIYKTLPDVPLSWRDVWTGALFTAGLFSLGKWAIGLYLVKSAIASGYGAAGSLVALLLWVYYSAQIFFLGAEFTKQYALRYGSLQVMPGPVSAAAHRQQASLPPTIR